MAIDEDKAIIHWDCGRAQVQCLGGMLGPVSFTLSDGRTIQPFAIAPWAQDDTPEHSALPGIMRRLRGEWPCVPFGAPSPPNELPENWQGAPQNAIDEHFHGYSSHHHWDVAELGDDYVVLSIDYPDAYPIRKLRRKICGRQGEPAIDCELTIETRADMTTSIALHPVFKLADRAGHCDIEADFQTGRVLPFDLEPEISQLLPDAEFASLDQVPSKTGHLSLQKLPLAFDTEELVQLCHAKGWAKLTNRSENYQVSLQYDKEHFPNLLLWISNRGRKAYPWNGGFTALGVEPVNGAFDLGPAVSAWQDNPLAKSGVTTTLKLAANATFTTRYTIAVQPC